MKNPQDPERIPIVVVGAGQAGLSVGYHLSRRGLAFQILDAHDRIGASWRSRWDSLRLFTPARYDGLDGLPFPAPPHSFPTKDQMADYLEAYARQFHLPVRHGVAVTRLAQSGGGYLVEAGDRSFLADHVVVAMANYQKPRVPAWARDLDTSIVQLHSQAYRNPAQLRQGDVLLVGAGNSGSEIALDLARAGHRVWMSGRDTGHIPFRMSGLAARLLLARLVFRVVFHRLLTVDHALGRRVRRTMLSQGGPLIRVRPADLAAAGVTRVAKTAGVRGGMPLLDGDRVLEVANVIFCTGFEPSSAWIDLPVFGPDGEPVQRRGVVADQPGLYFVGRQFLYAMSSTMIHGVGRDAAHVAGVIAARLAERAATVTGSPRPAPPAVHAVKA
jgi:putative flavoprotein involved in K+ transport